MTVIFLSMLLQQIRFSGKKKDVFFKLGFIERLSFLNVPLEELANDLRPEDFYELRKAFPEETVPSSDTQRRFSV